MKPIQIKHYTKKNKPLNEKLRNTVIEPEICDICNGSGMKNELSCSSCNGKGIL